MKTLYRNVNEALQGEILVYETVIEKFDQNRNIIPKMARTDFLWTRTKSSNHDKHLTGLTKATTRSKRP